MTNVAVVTGSTSAIGDAVRQQLEMDGVRVVGVDRRDAEVIADVSTSMGRNQAIVGAIAAAGGQIQKLVMACDDGDCVERADFALKVNYFGSLAVLDGLSESMTGVRDAAAVVVAASKSAQMPDLVSDDHPFMRALLENREERAIAMLPEQSAATPYPMPSHALARVVYKRATAWRKLGIRLNVITSGPTQTRIFPESTEISLDSPGVSATPLPLGRRARPEEIARMIRSLLCGDASSLRGSNMRGDDGADSTMRPETF